MATFNNGQFPANLPVLDGKNYDNWSKQMKVLFNYQDVMDQVINGVESLSEGATEVQRTQHKELKKKDYKALFIIHQSVSPDIFEKVGDCESAKQAWDILATAYAGDQKVKKVKLQTLRSKFAQLQMEEKETVSEFFTKIAKLVNEMKACGEIVSGTMRVEKILRSLTPKFDYVVAAIEESKDLDSIKVEELQGCLEAHEQRMNQRNSDKSNGEIALQVQQGNKNKKGKGKWQGNKGKDSYQNGNGKENQDTKGGGNQKKQFNGGRGGYNGGGRGGRGGRGKFDKKHIQCYNCQNYGHFADECRFREESSDAEAKMARNDDDDEGSVMLLVTTKDESDLQEKWYLDTGCTTHMTGRKDWFTSLKATQNHNVKFADNSSLAVQAIGDVTIKRKDGKCSVISGVLYIPGMKCNLLSIGQLLEKDYRIIMENRLLKVYNTKGNLMLKTEMSKNRTFKIGLNVLNHKCLMTASSREEWRWHYRMGHLNFKDLSLLQKSKMVTGLPSLQVPEEICEECVQSKQHRGSFSKHAASKTNSVLEVVYSDVCGPMQVNSIGGNMYFVSFIDDFSRKLWTYLISKKSDVFEIFKKFKATVERQSGKRLKTLRTDGGGEYVSHEFAKFCDNEGIVHDIVPPYTPQQNGTAERKNRTIMDMVRCMLKGKHLPKELWGEAVSTATYTLNRCPTKRLKGITPEECWSGHKPNVNHMRVFGSLVFKHTPDQLRKKLDDKSTMMILVGYHSTGGYKLYDPINNNVVISRDVIIDELKEWDWNTNDRKKSTMKGQELKVYKLKKALYGLKQAPRAWNKRIDKFLNEIGFKKCVTEHGVYVKKDAAKGVIIICLYVDDLLITGSNESYIREFKGDLKEEFEMTDLGLMTYFLGIEFLRNEQGILMHQTRYASEILKKFEMDKCNVALSPAEPRSQLTKCAEEEDVDPTFYRKLIGSLRYLCNTRPDLAYSVGIASRFMERPKSSHLIAVKRILRYVKGTINYGIMFPASDRDKECKLIGYTDSNWCGDHEDRKSTAGYMFFYGGSPISWCSKKEPVVALSSCEAEYIAASLSTCQAIWLKNLIEEISQDRCETVTLKIDNVSAINLAKNPIAHGRSKHIELRFHYLREQVSNGNLALMHCRSEEQVADLLTKAVTIQVFEKLRSEMGIETVDNMN
ncbi:unnamed protein product [Trifolium pratense]|uniref:Uncharacterized protein n=1 Tax=Trifolium pratense TaxID=57577 RepID=A0ACB0MCE2_TRIPR|nr:unnamed protein product [Trifolium pratense]